jgi:hypothetical protein
MRQRLDRVAAWCGGIWAVLAFGALLQTLRSLDTSGFDGLNNMLQVPFSLPWWLVIPAPSSHFADAWLTFAMAMVNAVLIGVVITRVRRRFLAKESG